MVEKLGTDYWEEKIGCKPGSLSSSYKNRTYTFKCLDVNTNRPRFAEVHTSYLKDHSFEETMNYVVSQLKQGALRSTRQSPQVKAPRD